MRGRMNNLVGPFLCIVCDFVRGHKNNYFDKWSFVTVRKDLATIPSSNVETVRMRMMKGGLYPCSWTLEGEYQNHRNSLGTHSQGLLNSYKDLTSEDHIYSTIC